MASNVPKMSEKVHENRTMSSSPSNGHVTKKPLSFSISSILGTDDKKSSDENTTPRDTPRDTEPPRVPLTTIHHFGSEAEANYYASFGKKKYFSIQYICQKYFSCNYMADASSTSADTA